MTPFWKFFSIGIAGTVLCILSVSLDQHVAKWVRIIFLSLPFAFLFSLLIYAIFKKKWRIFGAYSVGLIGCITLLILAQYGYYEFQDRIVYRITKHVDSTSKNGIYIPEDIAESHHELDKMLSSWLKREIKNHNSDEMSKYHFTLGLWIRNNWGLWANSRLAEHMKSLGFIHPDDMSATILNSYWCYLHGCDYDLSEHIEYYKQYWSAAESAYKVIEEEKIVGKEIEMPILPKPKSMCRCK